MNKFKILTKNEDETAQISTMIASFFELGDIVLLDGDLGTGKTFFVKAFALALGSSNLVTSPTFTIANFYEIKNGQLLHIDAYRLSGVSEFRDTGLPDFFSESITLIEWGSTIIDDFENYIHIKLDYDDIDKNHRGITFSYNGDSLALKFDLINKKLSNF